MTNNQLHVILATTLDHLSNQYDKIATLTKRYAFAQALAIEEQLSDDDTYILSAAALLYDFNEGPGETSKGIEGNTFQPIKVSNFIKSLLEETTVPQFEASAIASLVGLKDYGENIENPLHQLLLESQLLASLAENKVNIEKVTKQFKTAAGTRRLKELFSEVL